jgi:hypothetical protein
MAIAQQMPGTRLSFVVVKLEGTLRRMVTSWTKKDGLVPKEVPVPAGNLVYFPRGHVLRLSDEALVHYGLNKKPRMINMQGLHDPESPLGKMLAAQDDAARANAYNDLEQAVMHLAIAKSGPVIMPEMVKKMRFVEAKDYTTKGKEAA